MLPAHCLRRSALLGVKLPSERENGLEGVSVRSEWYAFWTVCISNLDRIEIFLRALLGH